MEHAGDTWIFGEFLDDSLQQQIASAEPDWLANRPKIANDRWRVTIKLKDGHAHHSQEC